MVAWQLLAVLAMRIIIIYRTMRQLRPTINLAKLTTIRPLIRGPIQITLIHAGHVVAPILAFTTLPDCMITIKDIGGMRQIVDMNYI